MKKIVFTVLAVVLLCLGIGLGINLYHTTQTSECVTQFLEAFYAVPDSKRYEAYYASFKEATEETPSKPGIISSSPNINDYLPVKDFFTQTAFDQFCGSRLLFYMDQFALKEDASISVQSLKVEQADSEFQYIATVVYTIRFNNGTQEDATHTWDIGTVNVDGIEKIANFRLRGVY